MPEWPILLTRSSGSEDAASRQAICVNDTQRPVRVEHRLGVAFQASRLHLPPWRGPELPVWRSDHILEPGEHARLDWPAEPGCDLLPLEVRFSADGETREHLYDLAAPLEEERQLPGEAPAFVVPPLVAGSRRQLPLTVIRRRPDGIVLNATAEVLAVNNTQETFEVVGLGMFDYRKGRSGGSLLFPGQAVKLHDVEPEQWQQAPQSELRYQREGWTFPAARASLRFEPQIIPIEEIDLRGITGGLLLPWREEAPLDAGRSYEIVPGESIGPVRLGMTKTQVDALGLGYHLRSADAFHFPLAAAGHSWTWQSAGIAAGFERGICRRVAAWLTLNPLSPPLFTLSGQVVNGMDDGPFARLLESLGPAPQVSGGGVKSLALGIHATKWERYDDYFTYVEVRPPGLDSTSDS